MDDSTDRLVEGLKVQIKKEIVDNYFADRVFLEEEMELLRQKTEAYRQEYELLGRRFMALYHALGSEAGCRLMMEVLNLKDWPFYEQYCALTNRERQELLESCPVRGFTAYRRFRNKILDLYELLHQDDAMLRESYDKIATHLKLLNEDIEKFNLSYDFGLIAAQIEALEGRGEAAMGGGLMSPEREELSSRMRFKRRKLDEQELPPPPDLPPLERIKDKLISIIDRICP
ncbi:MAG: hypothetical protein M1438_20375 [Deltaproteobacteria bacterium]|nr:hypothetical protein [Deltaproteobacteria bacterium]